MTLNQITISPVFPLWLILLLLFIGFGSVVAQYRSIREKLGRSRAFSLSLLRLGAITFLVAFALNPSLVAKKEHRVSPSIAVLLDTSQSMGQSRGSEKTSRLEEARSLLTEGTTPLLKSLREKFEVRLYGMGEALRPIEAKELEGLKAQGMKGDLSESLKELSGKNGLALLLSDGNLKWNEGGPPSLPVVTVPMGNEAEYKDILIKAVKAPSLAFRGREVAIDVTIKSYGYAGLSLPVLLKEGGKLITAKNTRIHASPSETIVSLSFIPDEVGQKNLSVSIPQQFGEGLLSNNSLNLSVKVVRDKIRVLMVSGNPSMNYRFMRIALKNDPSIDLLSFVILRTPSDILNVPAHEQSLIPFPVETLFSKEMKTFDLLIFDNLKYSLYLSPHHLESIKEFVRAGGGFAMIGGPNLFHEGRVMTPIGEILPVRFSEKEDYRRDSKTGVRLSRAGVSHPITRLSSDIAGDDRQRLSFWQEMPPLDGFNLLEPKSSATVLLESADGIPWPILTVSHYGNGRVLFLATDYSWKWDMGMVAKGKGNLAYLRLVDRMVRWLTKEPDMDPVQITLPESQRATGQEIEIRIKLSEEDLSPNLRSMVSFSVLNPDGLKIDSKLRPTGQPGEYLGSFVPQKGGIYRLRVETSAGHLEESIVVAGLLDTLDASPDHEQLKRISASTGGKFLLKGEGLLKEVEDYARRTESRFIEEKQSSLWTSPFVMVLVLGFLTLEWFFRRRWGLV
ncbi:MAG: glutamine amidotransferase [Thermodesulfobacteriota bacterium]